MKLQEALERIIKEGYILVETDSTTVNDGPGWTFVLWTHAEELTERGVVPDEEYTVWYARESDDAPFGDGVESYAHIAPVGNHGDPLYDRTIFRLTRPRILVTRWRDADAVVAVRVVTNIARGGEFLALDFRARADGVVLREMYDLRGLWVASEKPDNWVRYADHPRSASSEEWAILGGVSGLAEKIRLCHGFPRYDRVADWYGREKFPSIPAVLRIVKEGERK